MSYPCSRLAGMSWTRGLLAALAVCVVLVTGSVSCGASGEQGQGDGQSVSPVGKVLGDTDGEGRHYREVDKKNAPEVGIEVQPATDDCWSVRLTVENFAFSPDGTKAEAVSGRGVAVLLVDDRPVTTLRTPAYRLAAAYVPQGTHKVTARLYADDGTVWAVDGDPVESTADVTASKPQTSTGPATETPGAESTTGADGDGSGAESLPGAGESGARFAAVAGGGGSGARLTAGADDDPTATQPTAGTRATRVTAPKRDDAQAPSITITAGAGAGIAALVIPITASTRPGAHATRITAPTGARA
ncbi:Secreted protein OS=Streptomyces griseorubiginosus OX=67304 GN=AQJ54_27645 PE=4 SV=1 [Streptomyces griseorubiginosus]